MDLGTPDITSAAEVEACANIGLHLLRIASRHIDDGLLTEALYGTEERLADLWPCQRTACQCWFDAKTCRDPNAELCDLHFGGQT